jgi:YidC/Oxa1 family membrane protein insertase
MNKRLLLAMGLWFLLLLIMMSIFSNKENPQDSRNAANTEAVNPQGENIAKPADNTQAGREVYTVTPRSLSVREPDASEETVTVQTENYEITLNTFDASVESMKLRTYLEAGEAIDFIEENIKDYANFRVSFDGLERNEPPAENWRYQNDGEFSHIFTHEITSGFGRGLTLEKRYTFYEDAWHFDLEFRIRNRGGERWVSYRDVSYSLIWGSPIDWHANKEARSMYDFVSLAVYHAGDDKLDRVEEDKDVRSFRWIGLEDRYFLLSVIPLGEGNTQNSAVETASIKTAALHDTPAYLFSLNRHKLSLPAGEEARDTYRVFLGPKKYGLLTDSTYAPYRLSAILDSFVLIKWLGIALEQLMYFIYSIVSNYGIVIIIVTILIKILLQPLTKKSLVSMRKMQLLQPKIAVLREQFKSDPKRLNEEMMKLYKKEGVNPMGGCLPLLLQLPVFIALYQILPRFADLKNVSFLWVQDLSSPDTIATISAFRDIPLLPYNINILPIIMVVFSVLQTKLSSTGKNQNDPMVQQQRKMMMLMPVLFLLLFWNMPSGLVLYWTVQTIMSIVQQMNINRKLDAESAVPA